jgi:uncharacterized protein YyaL (SSP411 family)
LGLTAEGNWEGTNILHRPSGGDLPADLLRQARGALLAARADRVRPARDDKQLAAWNGFALRALAHAALVLGDERYMDATRTLQAFIEARLLREGDRLWRTARGGRSHTPAFAEDYFSVADGLLGAHAALGSAEALLLARRLVETALRDFWDAEAGTLVDTSDEHDRTVAQPRGLVDNATPSPNSMGADVLQRLALLTGEPDFDRRARSILRAVAPALERQPSAFGRMMCAVDRALAEAVDVVVASTASDPDGRRLREAAAWPYAPNLVLATVGPGDAHRDWPLFAAKEPRDGRATAYACRGYACDEPTSDPARLVEQVGALAAVTG